MNNKDLFQDKAQNWDKGNVQTSTASVIASEIKNTIHLNKDMQVIDFGVGTGLLGFEIAKMVKQVHGVDISTSMLEKLKAKNTKELSIKAYNQDIIKEPLTETFDGLVSSMTLHHVEDLELFFKTIYKNICKNGFIAIADLKTEDGTFHSDNTGVFHFGFEEELLRNVLKNTGFTDVKFNVISTIKKPQNDFDVFLLTAKRD